MSTHAPGGGTTSRHDARELPTGRRLGLHLALLAVRWSGLALAAGLAVAGMRVEAAVAMLVALAQVTGWRSRLPLPWEIATSAIALTAATSSYLMLYERIGWWDMPVHFALNGVLAVLVARVVRSPWPSTAEVVVTGAVLAVVWELMELAGNRWVDSSIHVPPADTAGDLAAGLAGTVAAALLWRGQRDHHSAEDRRGGARSGVP